MPQPMIEAQVLQDETRTLLELLQRIQALPPDTLLPVAEVDRFTTSTRKFFMGGINAGCIFTAIGCDLELPGPWIDDLGLNA